MLVTENPGWAANVRHLAAQARDRAPHYEHSRIGYNYRLSNLLAAIGRGQLAVLEERIARRRANFEFYRKALSDVPGIEFMPQAPFSRSTRWLSCLLIDRDVHGTTPTEICAAMAVQYIEARPMWKPMHQQPVYSGCRTCGGKVADEIFRTGLCLPSGSALSECDLHRVADAFRATLSGCPTNLAA